MNKPLLTLVLAVVILPLCSHAAAPRHHQVSATVFTKAEDASFWVQEAEMRCSVVERVSPDGKYVARIECADAEVGQLYVARAGKRTRRHFQHRYLLRIDDVQGCVWLPGHGHALAYSAGGCDYGRGYLGVWNGRNHLLRRAPEEAGEGFDITAYDATTRKLSYEHLTMTTSGGRLRESLILPPRYQRVNRRHTRHNRKPTSSPYSPGVINGARISPRG